MSRGGRVIQICRHGIEAGKSMKIGEYQNYRLWLVSGRFEADAASIAIRSEMKEAAN
jgi:hypothetical protein